MIELTSLIDGSVIIAAFSTAGYVVKAVYDIKKQQKRMYRDMYGADKDESRPGVINQQYRHLESMDNRFDEIEEQLDELESQMVHRHDEITFALRRITQEMDNPPEDIWRADNDLGRED